MTLVRHFLVLLILCVFSLPVALAQSHAGGTQLESEFDFLAGMIPHHEGALASAELALTKAQRPEVTTLAKAIIAAQQAEISKMQGWLGAWYPGRATGDAASEMNAEMAGMSDASLSDLSGDAFDKAFLAGMVSHHRMAVEMADTVLNRDLAEHDEVRTLAAEVVETQETEIRTMQGWLKAWYGAAPPSAGHGSH